jgi:hypothetical protein
LFESTIDWPFADGHKLVDGMLEVGVVVEDVLVDAEVGAEVGAEVVVALVVAFMKLYGVLSSVHLFQKESSRGVASNGDPAAREGQVCPRPCT